MWAWKEQYGGEIVDQIKRMGASLRLVARAVHDGRGALAAPFARRSSAGTRTGLIYRGERLVNWCPTDQTGLSDSEVEHEDVEGELVTFRYPLVGRQRVASTCATTRVETMLGDTGIAVHPGRRTVRARWSARPFVIRSTGGEIPIVADAAIDPAFGTGAVKVTPAHDPIDFEIAQRAGLPLMNIFRADATINENAAEEFYGLGRYDARIAVREELEKLDLIVEEIRPYVHSVGHCYRCHSEIEPWIAGPAVVRRGRPADAVRRRRPRSTAASRSGPSGGNARTSSWLDNLRDWNISRQLWWGHRIPAWYCPDGHVTVAREDPDACATCGSTDARAGPRRPGHVVLVAALAVSRRSGWPDDTEDLRFFYPNAVLVTGYEILYLWVARMIMSGMSLMGDVPFRNVVIHGLVRDGHGRKMSKSLGNVIDPIEMIDRYGADALRFSLARSATGGQQDIPLVGGVDRGRPQLREQDLERGAAGASARYPGGEPELPPADRLTRARALAALAPPGVPDRGRCGARRVPVRRRRAGDLPVPLVRVLRLGPGDGEGRDSTARAPSAATPRNVLAWVLERTLRLLHPVMPFVTEEIWQRFGVGPVDRRSRPGPSSGPDDVDADAEAAFALVQDVVTAVRQFRSLHGISPAVKFEATAAVPAWGRPAVESLSERIQRLAGVTPFAVVDPLADKPPGWITR